MNTLPILNAETASAYVVSQLAKCDCVAVIVSATPRLIDGQDTVRVIFTVDGAEGPYDGDVWSEPLLDGALYGEW